MEIVSNGHFGPSLVQQFTTICVIYFAFQWFIPGNGTHDNKQDLKKIVALFLLSPERWESLWKHEKWKERKKGRKAGLSLLKFC